MRGARERACRRRTPRRRRAGELHAESGRRRWQSPSSACVMSTSPMPGTVIVVAGSAPSRRARRPTGCRSRRWPHGLLRGLGRGAVDRRAGRRRCPGGQRQRGPVRPAVAVLHSDCAGVRGDRECHKLPDDSALASQFQPATDAGADRPERSRAIERAAETFFARRDPYLGPFGTTARNDDRLRNERVRSFGSATVRAPTKRPSCCTTSPSAVSRPPSRRSQMRSQCSALRVLASGLGIGAPEREVDGAADLLVEEDRAGRAVDAEVRADADLAEAPRAVVGGQRALQVVVADAPRARRRPRRRAARARRRRRRRPAGARAHGEAHAAVRRCSRAGR